MRRVVEQEEEEMEREGPRRSRKRRRRRRGDVLFLVKILGDDRPNTAPVKC